MDTKNGKGIMFQPFYGSIIGMLNGNQIFAWVINCLVMGTIDSYIFVIQRMKNAAGKQDGVVIDICLIRIMQVGI